MLSNYINKTTFYSYAGFSAADVNDAYVDLIISQVNYLILQKLSGLFQIRPNFTFDYFKRNSREIIFIDHWQPAGVVDTITVTAGGSGYTTAPTITLTGNATAKANISSGVITSIDITYPGQPGSYTTPPTVTVTGGSGTGASAVATISTLLIQRGTDDSTNFSLTPLVEHDDYRLIYSEQTRPDRTFPVVAIKLYFVPLWLKQFLRVTGTFGYSAIIPTELGLDMEMYEAIKQIIMRANLDTETGGRGLVSESAIDKVKISFKESKNLTLRDMLNDLTYRLDSIVSQYEATSPRYMSTIVG